VSFLFFHRFVVVVVAFSFSINQIKFHNLATPISDDAMECTFTVLLQQELHNLESNSASTPLGDKKVFSSTHSGHCI
jgi:hypothetical protein